jgi:branched-chain amino acid transport system permease protein
MREADGSRAGGKSASGTDHALGGTGTRDVIASEAKQSSFSSGARKLDCFVAALLAMTAKLGARSRLLPILLFLGLAAAPLAGAVVPESYLLALVGRAMVLALAALSLDFILGLAGLVSFGHAAFLGIGAYAVGILASHGHEDLAVQLPVALAASAIFALLTGAVSLRTRGVYFIMITLAFGQMAFFTAASLSAYGGDDGMTLYSRSTVFGSSLLDDDRVFYFAVLGVLLAAYLLLRRIAGSRFGRVVVAARENERRVRALGFDPYRYRLVAYVLAGTVAGLAGLLAANQTEYVSPAVMAWQRSGELLVMVILGGIGSLHGAVLGALAFLLVEEVLSHYSEHWRVIFGPLLIAVVLFAPGGLAGLFRRRRDG